MKSPFILITGGSGFIGSHLVERLLAEGNAVVVIDDFSTGRLENLRAVEGNPNLRVIDSRISTCTELSELAGKAKAIYHLAAAVGVELVVKSPIHTLETNLHETEVLLKAAAEHRTPLLLASTSEVYGKSEKPVFSEEDDLLIGPPNRSRWGYACSKLMDEFLALAYAREKLLPVTIVRLFNTVGPRQTGQYGMVLPRFISAAKRGEPLMVHGDGQQSRCFCFVRDTVEALVRLQNCPAARGEVFNIGSTEEISIVELAKLVVSTLGSKSPIELIPYDQAYAPGFEDMRRRKPSVEKLAAAVGFRPATPLRDTIRQTAETLP
ncbi:MAG TPA: NAD-dependent epimerase/dehydratase family protein [Verrucomicrobiae bacterium]|nr:NAD-dependent epimerase/dehydratase family protein [Verrucomicrobiae bacterium]